MKKGFSKILIYLLLTLFAIPVATLMLSEYAGYQLNNEITEAILDNARQNNQDLTKVNAFLQAHPPRSVCDTVTPDLLEYKHAVCNGNELWQFETMDKVIFLSMGLGLVFLVLVGVLGGVAFISPGAQAWSLRLSRPVLIFMSFVEVIVQGGLLLWFTFWISAFFTDKYYPKAIFAVALLILAGLFYMVKGIFRRIPFDNQVEGAQISRTHAPALWARMDNLASRLGTTAPDHIVAGIDASFYVTEVPLTVKDRKLTGRTLYVSLPLLRHLTPEQADGVMVHELTHLHQGDSATNATLGPKIQRFDLYISTMKDNLATLLVYYPLAVYRTLFELAWQRDSRRREFIADNKAAQIAGPATIAQSLVKVSAYSGYWGEVENELFAQDEKHESSLQIRQTIAQGLTQYAHSNGFSEMIRRQNVPHPFDSHPPLSVRMKNVGYEISSDQLAAVATHVPEESWANLIPDAEEIEQALWQRYEHEFSSAHEESLAWRYRPEDAAQTALVEKYFPPQTYTLRKGKTITISWQGITEPKHGELLRWEDISTMTHDTRCWIDYLALNFEKTRTNKRKRLTIYLPGIGKQMDALNESLGRYWVRHQTMCEHQRTLREEQHTTTADA